MRFSPFFPLHGCYNLFIASNFIISFILIIISWIIALRLFFQLKKIQKYKKKENMKKKLHNSLISFLRFFLIFLNFSYVNSAQTNCETFKKDLNILGYSMRPTGLYNTYGFVLKENYNIPENKWEFSKSNGNYQAGKIFDPELIKNITPGDEIISLNGKEFDYELFKNENELLFEFKTTKNENLKKNLKSKQYSIFDPV